MINAAGTVTNIDGSRPLMIIGLAIPDLVQLAQGVPIRFNATELGLPDADVVLIGGRDEFTLLDHFARAGWISPTADFTAGEAHRGH